MKKLALFCVVCALAANSLAQDFDAVKFTQGETTHWYLLANDPEAVVGNGVITIGGHTYDLANGMVESIFGIDPSPKVGDIFTVAGITYEITAIAPNAVKVGDNQSYGNSAVVIPDFVEYSDWMFNVTEISESAFEGCTNLTSAIIPEAIKEIGQHAFKDCANLTNVNVSWVDTSDLPILGSDVFQGIAGGEGPAVATLHVPSGTTDIYNAAEQWKNFIIDDPKTPTGVGNVTGQQQIKVTKIIHKGQVYIIRNDKTYNTQGVEVELY